MNTLSAFWIWWEWPCRSVPVLGAGLDEEVLLSFLPGLLLLKSSGVLKWSQRLDLEPESAEVWESDWKEGDRWFALLLAAEVPASVKSAGRGKIT